MTSVAAVGPTNGSSPTEAGDEASVQKALQEGIANFMLAILQSAEGDLISAINDTTSDPDAAG
jgi:hypothetical protein